MNNNGSSAKVEYCACCGKELTTYRVYVRGEIFCSLKCADCIISEHDPRKKKTAGMVQHE